MILYDDFAYAHGRLVGTIVRYKGKPVMVNDMIGNKVFFTYLQTQTNDEALYSPHFDLTPVPLGYTNYGANSFYMARIPMRKDWKQGLRSTTTRCIITGMGNYEGPLPFPEIHKAIVADMPSLEVAIHNVKALGNNSSAFNRSFAIDTALDIWHKGCRNIGKIINPKTHEYSLKDEFFWARETLEEAL
jgi:hypothetical protein